MRTKTSSYTLIIFIIAISQVCCKGQVKALGSGEVEFPKQNITIAVEIAETEDQKSKGLMFKEQLPTNKGMLFVYEQEKILSVWMKNTLIPLDILFVSEQGVIVSIFKNAQPCMKVPCKIYRSKKSVTYILEINAGLVDKNNIRVGQRLKINVFPTDNSSYL